MWKGRFKEETSEKVLDFTQSLDLDWKLAFWDVQGSRAHARMLHKVGLLDDDEAMAIDEGLSRILEEIESGTFLPKKELEDVHMNIEARLTEMIGPVGAKLHTGRSRNDQIATTLRLFLRDKLKETGKALAQLEDTFLTLAKKHRDLVVPGYTHLQQAQPISMGHYWLAHFWAFMRDAGRLLFALDSLDECPLGSGALAGSTLPLDRHLTAELLGFSAPSWNSIDSVAQRDYLIDIHVFAVQFCLHVSRLAEDLILYSTQEFGWVLLPDAFCTGSSMMPQKKNPDVLELCRGKAGQAIGHLVDALVLLKGLPLAYDRDLQEDKRGLFASLELLDALLWILPPLLERIEIDATKARRGFENGLALATDVAEYLVLKGIPFRKAHEKVGKAVSWCLDHGRSFSELSLEEWRSLIPEVDSDLLGLLSPEASVQRRNTWGGTAPEQVDLQIEEGRKRVRAFEESLSPLKS